MIPTLRRTAQLLALLVTALLLGASATVTSAAAQAAPVTVTLTAEGPTPEFLEVQVGGTVVFVNGDDTQHRVVATEEAGKSTEWAYDSSLIEPGATSPPTEPFTAAGRYTFQDQRGLLLPQAFNDEINALPAPSPSPSPSGESQPNGDPSASPGASGSPSAGAGSPGPSGSASPGAPLGSGTTAPLPLSGGFAGTGTTPIPIPGVPLAPAIAPPPLLPDATSSPLPYVAAPVEISPSIAALPTGSLPGVDTGRDRGLPAVLAALLVVGIVSMLVRVLLAEPAARRSAEPARGLRPVVVTG